MIESTEDVLLVAVGTIKQSTEDPSRILLNSM